jgi:hypothetical protein
MFAWNIYNRSDCHRSLCRALAPDAASALLLMAVPLTACEDQDDPAATHYLERGNARAPEARVWLRAP